MFRKEGSSTNSFTHILVRSHYSAQLARVFHSRAVFLLSRRLCFSRRLGWPEGLVSTRQSADDSRAYSSHILRLFVVCKPAQRSCVLLRRRDMRRGAWGWPGMCRSTSLSTLTIYWPQTLILSLNFFSAPETRLETNKLFEIVLLLFSSSASSRLKFHWPASWESDERSTCPNILFELFWWNFLNGILEFNGDRFTVMQFRLWSCMTFYPVALADCWPWTEALKFTWRWWVREKRRW